MTEIHFDAAAFGRKARAAAGTLAAAFALCALPAMAQQATAPKARTTPRTADYILAIVNQELVTNGELEQRLARIRDTAQRNGTKLPPAAELRQQVLDALIDERVQVTHARENGQRVDDAELDRAVANVAAQNQITLTQLRQRLTAEGMDFTRFRNNIRDQIMIERIREREVQGRIKVTEAEIDALLDKQRAQAGNATEYNIAQILVTVPEGASDAVVAERKAKLDAALARVRGGEAFEAVAKEVSEDANRANGGVIGLRASTRLPDVFVEQVRGLKAGEIAPQYLRTAAGFHSLKLIERREAGAFSITQTHARHILLRPSAQLTQEAAVRRLSEFKRVIGTRANSFEQLAKDNSEDGSAPQGGDLGWASPGQFVPEFEEAMNALPIGGISDPLVSRFGVHLIQVIDRRQTTLDPKQQREQAKNVLREQKFDPAYLDWLRDLRARAYIEMREPPV
ncbi:peptidylprolyl isomerase [Piscinibacter terrae]|uniref:Chaperone SurA n=1 Tax=Piscinibacter terrae TaxID=2496871 RepID=A0A3N7HNU1_9BURK|nr:peptidylprolyl isomerase [Albitalea terrae]RQP22371.1 molecular chaperone SurA [Albitalea terrae]